MLDLKFLRFLRFLDLRSKILDLRSLDLRSWGAQALKNYPNRPSVDVNRRHFRPPWLPLGPPWDVFFASFFDFNSNLSSTLIKNHPPKLSNAIAYRFLQISHQNLSFCDQFLSSRTSMFDAPYSVFEGF